MLINGIFTYREIYNETLQLQREEWTYPNDEWKFLTWKRGKNTQTPQHYVWQSPVYDLSANTRDYISFA